MLKYTNRNVDYVEFEKEIVKHQGGAGHFKISNRKALFAASEHITRLITFIVVISYPDYIGLQRKGYFYGLVSYNRFVELQQSVAVPIMLFLKTGRMRRSLCHNSRIHPRNLRF